MKKIIAITLALVLVSALSSCSDNTASNDSSNAPPVSDSGGGSTTADTPEAKEPEKSTTTATDAAAPVNPFGNIGPRANTYDDPEGGVYVSPTGNDATATGAADKPFKSINAALAAAGPGDTIILRGGTYREGISVRIRDPNITIKSAKGEWAVIDLTVHDPGADEDSGVRFDVDSSGGKLQCVEVMGGFYAVCTETRWDWGDPADRGGASDIIIEDCVLHDSKYEIVKIKPNCNNITIRHNELYNAARAEFGTPDWDYGEAHAEAIDNVNGDNMVVQNNYIHDVNIGLYAKGGAAGVLIENNRIERVTGAGIMVGFDTSPEWFDLDANPQYYESIGCIVRNNLIIDAGWEGIGLYAAKDAQVYNNTLVNVDNGPGEYHSAIYFGLTYQDWESYAGRPASVNPNIHHNIVCQPASFNRQMIEIRYSNDLGGMSALDGNPAMSDNCYYIAGKSAAFSDYRTGSALENAGLAEWQAHIGGDSGSIETDPGLDADYMPTNPLCAEMGIKGTPTVSVSSSASASTSTSTSASASAPAAFPLISADDYGDDEAETINLGEVIYVDGSFNGGSQDGTPSNPYRTVQAAVDAASDSKIDTIKVAGGVYREAVRISQKKVRLLGGFTGGGDFTDADPHANRTVIEGTEAAPCILVSIEERAITGALVISGFTICKGRRGIELSGAWSGYLDNIIIRDNIIEENGTSADDQRGGGIGLEGSNVTIRNNFIRNNQAVRGAAIGGTSESLSDFIIAGNRIENNKGYGDHAGGVIINGTGLITRNIFDGNVTDAGLSNGYGWGGAICIVNYDTTKLITLSHNVWRNNHAPSRGGAVFVDEAAKVFMINELLYNNTCSESGSAIYVDQAWTNEPSILHMENCTVSGNSGGAALYVEASSAYVQNCIFWNNGEDFELADNGQISVDYTLAQQESAGTGNISLDPLFADAPNGDFHVLSKNGRFVPSAGEFVSENADSPAIDAGNPSSDFSKEPEPNGGRVNLGCYGNTAEASKSAGN